MDPDSNDPQLPGRSGLERPEWLAHPPGQATVDTEWGAAKVSLPVLFYWSSTIVGIGFLLFPIVGQIDPSPSMPRNVVTFFVFAGLIAVVFGSASIRPPAAVVTLRSDGTFTFLSNKRQLVVRPGELRSIRVRFNDSNRVNSLRVNATSGTISLSSRMENLESLERALREANPDASLPSLSRWKSKHWYSAY